MMDGTDLRRRMGWSAAQAKALAQSTVLRRRQPDQAPATAADCVKLGREPDRRLEPLRRGQGAGR